MYAGMHACMHACMYVCMYLCMYVHTHMYIYIYIYIYKYYKSSMSPKYVSIAANEADAMATPASMMTAGRASKAPIGGGSTCPYLPHGLRASFG